MKCEKIVAEMADIVKVLANKSLTMSFNVRHLADIGVIWRSNDRVRTGVARENAAALAPRANFRGSRRNAENAGDAEKLGGGMVAVVMLLRC